MSVTVRPARRDDLAAFYGDVRAAPTVKAAVMVIDGRVCALGGIARRNGRRIAFFDLDEEARRPPVVIGRAARRFLQAQMKERRAPTVIFAEADPDEAGAERWLEVLGFRPVTDKAGVYRWQG